MGVFKDMLGSGETLFKNPLALDYDFLPKTIPFREQEQKTIVSGIMPLLHKRNGRNMFVYGSPGIGKTAAVRSVLRELEDETDEIIPVYVNCWSKNTTFKVFSHICEELGYPFTQNKKTEDLYKIIKERVNQKAGVFVFDEIDKAEDIDFVYMIIEEIYRSSIILITNYHEWIIHLDQRIKSRLMPESLVFKPYNMSEVSAILSERVRIGFYEGVYSDDILSRISERTHSAKDIRTGLFLLRESATHAEERSSKKVSLEDVDKALSKIEDFKIKSTEDLDKESLDILRIIKENTGERIGRIFELFSENNDASYKTFQRRIARLEKGKYIFVESIPGGSEGKTSILHYNAQR